MPRHRTGDLLRATLPAQAEWGREHPEAPRITAATINKQLGAVQSICVWANENGLVPDDVQWTDPFSKLRLPEERSERTSFDVAELQLLFSSPLFTDHRFPLGSHGAAGFWLPVLALFTGARQAELGSLTAANVQTDAETGVVLLNFVSERARGKRVKTEASERVVPVHPDVIRLGFLSYVEARKRDDGADAWLFPSVSPDKGRAGVPAFSQWFGRYLRASGVTDTAKVFHSFRHTAKDACVGAAPTTRCERRSLGTPKNRRWAGATVPKRCSQSLALPDCRTLSTAFPIPALTCRVSSRWAYHRAHATTPKQPRDTGWGRDEGRLK